MATNDNLSTQKPSGAAGSDRPSRQSKAGWIVAAILLLLLVGGGLGVYFYFNFMQTNQAEETAYAILEDNCDTADYAAFLAAYPESRYPAEVQARLEDLRREASAWDNLRLSDNVLLLRRFLDEHAGNKRLALLCGQRSGSLDGVAARKEGTPEADQRYREQHPDGRYLAEASVAEDNAIEMQLTDEERVVVEATVENFFNAFAANDDATYCSLITPTMKHFLGKKNATKADVIASISRMFNEHIERCTFTINDDYEIEKLQEEGQTAFRAAFSVDQRITRDNEGKTLGSYKAEVRLNSQFKLTALQMTEISAKRD